MAKLNLKLAEMVAAAREAATNGEQKARQVNDLLRQAQDLEKELAALRKEHATAEASLAQTLAEAEALRPVLGEEALAQAKQEAAELRASWKAEEAEAEQKLNALREELKALNKDPELQAYLALREQERLREFLPQRFAALRQGAQSGEGAEELADLARQAARVGLLDLAAQAQDLAEVAHQVAVESRRAGLVRWAKRQAQKALILVVNYDQGQGLALQPRPTRRGGVYFEVVGSHGLEEAPEALSALPARSRLWRGSQPDVKGLSPLAARLVKKAAAKGMQGRKVNALLAELTAPATPAPKAKAPAPAPKTTAAPAVRRPKKAANRRKAAEKAASRPAGEVGEVNNSLADLLADEVRQKLAEAA